MASEELSVKEALNEYFRLKLKYEDDIMKDKKKIINNSVLSNREKRAEYLSLKPKCINCKKPGGTSFKILYSPPTEQDDSSREYRASCSVVSDPCNLDIKIKLFKVDLLSDILTNMENDIKKYKNNVIDDKNKLLFSYIDTESALEKFEVLKEDISLTSTLYEEYLSEYNKVVDNSDKKTELEESITNSYIQIEKIKDCIKKMNETGNVQFASDAVSIYNTILFPLLSKIRNLKYAENIVVYNEQSNTYNLIQNRFSLENLTYGSSNDIVVSFNVGYDSGLQGKKSISRKKLIIESETESEKESESEPTSSVPKPSGEIPREEPIYGEGADGITWRNKEYNALWSNMPEKLKNALRPNQEWLTDFMFNCVNARVKGEKCVIITPKDIKLPPIVASSGQYDFGIPIYNELFNKLDKSLKETYLTMFREKDGFKDWKMLENAMNDLVAKEVGMDKRF